MSADIANTVRDFFSKYPVKTFQKGEVMVQAEEDPAGVFYLLEGRVSEYDISSHGVTVVVNVFKSPAFFPMSWAMNQTPNLYFFEAATDVRVHVAPPGAVNGFLRDNPDVLYDLLARVYKGTDGLLRRMAHLMGGDARSRLQFELLNAAYRFGDQRPDGSVVVPLKESDLAHHSGLARETVNRLVQQFKAAGLIEVNHQGFILRDLKRLQDDLGRDL